MKLLRCPLNGLRPIDEFAYGGEVRDAPDPRIGTDEQWADYVFNRNGSPGIKREWWYHIASGYWFIAERDTASDVVRETYGVERLQRARGS